MCHLLRFPVLSSSPPYAESCFLGSWVHSFYPVLNKKPCQVLVSLPFLHAYHLPTHSGVPWGVSWSLGDNGNVGLVWSISHYAIFSLTLGHCCWKGCTFDKKVEVRRLQLIIWSQWCLQHRKWWCAQEPGRKCSCSAPSHLLHCLLYKTLSPYCQCLVICSLHCMAAGESCLAGYQAKQEWYGWG